MLYIVATPIGNMEDISYRAVSTLKEVDLILAEDTRHFSKLAKRYDINTKTKSNHEHNEIKQIDYLLDLLKSEKKIALVSDAGTPCISDPGYRIVRACHENNIKVCAIPGACAAISAISISGLPSDKFFFKGFLPIKSGKKEKELISALDSETTCIYYESPHRIVKTLNLIAKLCDDSSEHSNSKHHNRELFVIREISKKFETYYRGLPLDIIEEMGEKTKGEFVLIISKAL